jgi:HSP20 family protein
MEASMNLRSLVPFSDGGTLARSNPFGLLQREVDRLFDEFSRSPAGLGRSALFGLVPTMDVKETDKDIEVAAELPGLERNDIDISVDDGELVIRGEKKAESEQDDKNYHLAERSYGAFYRSLPLPRGVDPSSIQATMAKGVLKVIIPKPAKSDAKKIEVKEAA